MTFSAQLAAAEKTAIVDLTVGSQAVRDRRCEGSTVQQAVGADRFPAPSEAHQAKRQQTLPALHKPNICSGANMPLAAEASSGTPTNPHIPCVEGQNFLLDQVVMRDVLRVLGDSRPHASFSAPDFYASLQMQYLQHIPGSQAGQQGRLLVYLEWLTQRLFQHELAQQHQQLYAAVLEMCKVSQVPVQVMPSAPQLASATA